MSVIPNPRHTEAEIAAMEARNFKMLLPGLPANIAAWVAAMHSHMLRLEARVAILEASREAQAALQEYTER